MKNRLFNIAEYLFYLSFGSLILIYLFPGSLIGYFLYGNFDKQPNIVNNSIGTSINHFSISCIFNLQYKKDKFT